MKRTNSAVQAQNIRSYESAWSVAMKQGERNICGNTHLREVVEEDGTTSNRERDPYLERKKKFELVNQLLVVLELSNYKLVDESLGQLPPRSTLESTEERVSLDEFVKLRQLVHELRRNTDANDCSIDSLIPRINILEGELREAKYSLAACRKLIETIRNAEAKKAAK